MWRFLRSKAEHIEAMAVERTAHIVYLRGLLQEIRRNNTQWAVDFMEVLLDSAVIEVTKDLRDLRPSIRDLVEDELKRLWLYRRDSPGRSANWPDSGDRAVRESQLSGKAKAEEILSRYKTEER